MAEYFHKKAAHLIGHPTLSKRESRTLSGSSEWTPSEIAAGAVQKIEGFVECRTALGVPVLRGGRGGRVLFAAQQQQGMSPQSNGLGQTSYQKQLRAAGPRAPEPGAATTRQKSETRPCAGGVAAGRYDIRAGAPPAPGGARIVCGVDTGGRTGSGHGWAGGARRTAPNSICFYEVFRQAQ